MKAQETTHVTRRSILRASAAGAAGAASLGASGTAVAQSEDFDGWLSDTGNYDGEVLDRRGQSEVRIEVGAGQAGFLFDPPAVQIDPGTAVVWEWVGAGGRHNVHAIEGADFQSETTDEDGHTFSQTIDGEGIVKYQCDPHSTIGMKGVLVVGDVQVGSPPKRPDFGGWLEDVDGGFRDVRGQESVSVSVGAAGNGGQFAFEPAGLWIDPGTEITWEWTGKGSFHNVHAIEGGDFTSETTDEEGFTYTQTIDSTGIITYQCDPHAQLGMKGAIAVGDDVPTLGGDGPGDGDDDDGGGISFRAPGGPLGTTIVGAVLGLTGLAAFAVLASEYRSLLSDRRAATAEDATVQPTAERIEREIEHEEFDPVGTASLIALYFLILVGLWVFMYFVEFLGNGPTVIG